MRAIDGIMLVLLAGVIAGMAYLGFRRRAGCSEPTWIIAAVVIAMTVIATDAVFHLVAGA